MTGFFFCVFGLREREDFDSACWSCGRNGGCGVIDDDEGLLDSTWSRDISTSILSSSTSCRTKTAAEPSFLRPGSFRPHVRIFLCFSRRIFSLSLSLRNSSSSISDSLSLSASDICENAARTGSMIERLADLTNFWRSDNGDF